AVPIIFFPLNLILRVPQLLYLFLGTGSIFKISPSTASRLKELAHKHHMLKVKKNYETVSHKKAMLLYIKYNDKRINIVFHQGKYRLQLIDTVLPHFHFKKRQKLKT